MSGPTKGGNFIIQSGMADRLALPLRKLLDRPACFSETQEDLPQLATVHDYMALSPRRRHSDQGVLEMASTPNPLQQLLAMTRLVRSGFPQPLVIPTENGDISVDQILDEAEEILNNGVPTPDAAVAQPAEQVPRKDEVVGSTPSSSSTGFTDVERELMARIVRNTNALMDSREIIKKKQAEITKLRTETNARIEVVTQQVNQEQSRAKIYEEAVRESEDKFRLSMIQSSIIKPALLEEAPAPQEEEIIDLGRGE